MSNQNNQSRSRKWQLTINNPDKLGLPHEQIKKNISSLKSVRYYCMCDEQGSTYHTHLFIYSNNAISFETLFKRFNGAHIESAKGSCLDNRNYIRKDGKHKDTDKAETNLPDTFEEWGEIPAERQEKVKQSEAIVEMIEDGASTVDIIKAYPTAITKQQHIHQYRQEYLKNKYSVWRDVEVIFIYGNTGVGKTRYVMEKYGYTNVCKVSNYAHPFDNYDGQDVILFDEFNGQITLTDMLQFLDGYPCMLPARYADRVACFTKAYIISNTKLEEQYHNVKNDNISQWYALMRRVKVYYHMDNNGVMTQMPIPGEENLTKVNHSDGEIKLSDDFIILETDLNGFEEIFI